METDATTETSNLARQLVPSVTHLHAGSGPLHTPEGESRGETGTKELTPLPPRGNGQTSTKQNHLGRLTSTGIRDASEGDSTRIPPIEVRQPSEPSMINRGRYPIQTSPIRVGEPPNSEDCIVTRISTGTLCGLNMIRSMAIRNELLTLGAIPPLTREEGERTRDFFGAMGKNGVVDTLLDLARSLNVPFRVTRPDGSEWLHVAPQQGTDWNWTTCRTPLAFISGNPSPSGVSGGVRTTSSRMRRSATTTRCVASRRRKPGPTGK